MNGKDQECYLVTGANGFQGAAVVRALADPGRRVRGLGRKGADPARPAVPGVTRVTGDLGDPADVRRAFDGVTHAVVTLPLVFDPPTVRAYVRHVVAAARQVRLRRLVFNTGIVLPEQPTRYAVFETRREAEAMLRDSGVPLVVLRPTIYLDNLFSPWTGPALVNDGVLGYPLAADRRVAWLSHRDLAAATVAALTRDDLVGETIDVGGRDRVTGPELAAAFAQALGRDVRYLALDPEAFRAGLGRALGAELADGVAGIYQWAAGEADPTALDVDPAEVEKRLGVSLTPLSRWIDDQPWAQWRATDGQQ